jgi:hypothetical protein
VDLQNGRQAGFVVTNKHVFGATAADRLGRNHVYFYFQRKGATSTRPAEENISLIDFGWDNPDRPWREHPDQAVDVLAFDVTPLLMEHDDIQCPKLDYEHFAFTHENHGIAAGSHLFVVGYPGVASFAEPDNVVPLMQASTLQPIVKWSVAATNPTEDLSDLSAQRDYRGFLVDGLTLPGMSGSPVFLAEPRYVLPTLPNNEAPADPLTHLTARLMAAESPLWPRPPLLVGIVAETRFVAVEGIEWAQMYAGVGLAYNADTIKETIDLFHDYRFAESIDRLPRRQLYERARLEGIKGRSRMSKAELIKALRGV